MRHILLTGASSGIGKELLSKLSEYDVFAPTHEQLDLADSSSIDQIDYSKFDTIINCAGINKGTYLGFENNSDKNQLEQVMVNYYGPLMMLKRFLKSNDSGTFCYVSSYSIIDPYAYNIINASAKTALQYSIDVLRNEYKNFRFVEIMPSKTKTNMLHTNYQGAKTREDVEKEYNSSPYLNKNFVADQIIYALTNTQIEHIRIRQHD